MLFLSVSFISNSYTLLSCRSVEMLSSTNQLEILHARMLSLPHSPFLSDSLSLSHKYKVAQGICGLQAGTACATN